MVRAPSAPALDRHGRRIASLLLATTLCGSASAQQVPVRSFGMRDGLPHSRVNTLLSDSRGFLWLGTWEGLARFDGQQFTTFATGEGTDSSLVWALAEDASGRIWAGTHDGLVRLAASVPGAVAAGTAAEAGGDVFRFSADRDGNVVSALAFDEVGRCWCVTPSGVHLGQAGPDGTWSFERLLPTDPERGSPSLLRRADGSVVAVARDAVILFHGRELERIPRRTEERDGPMVAALTGPDGEAIVLQEHAVFRLAALERAGDPEAWERLVPEEIEGRILTCAVFDPSGDLWIGTNSGLLRSNAKGVQVLGVEQGLGDDWVHALAIDRNDGLWVATESGGACRISNRAFVSWGRAQGLDASQVMSTVEGADGRVYATTWRRGTYEIRDASARLVEGSLSPAFSNLHTRLLCDRRGDFWVGTDEGLWRFEGPGLQFERGRRFGAADGFTAAGVYFRMHEDSAGRIWIGGLEGEVFVHDPARREGPSFERVDGNEIGPRSPVRIVLVDRDRAAWIAPHDGLWRLRGRELQAITPPAEDWDGGLAPRALFLDSRGALWVGDRRAGVFRILEPGAAAPRFERLSTEGGLSSSAVLALAEDGDGRMLLGTSRGLDRLERFGGRVHHFSRIDGLAGDQVYDLRRDEEGRVWIATTGGVTRFDPRLEARPSPPPPVYVTHVAFGGSEVARSSGGLVEPGTRDNLTVDYAGIDFRGPHALRYRYRLEGVDEDWSQPVEQTTVHYAHLAPGDYRFEVEAVDRDGIESPEPARLEFRILPPFWRRPWFVLACALAVGGTAFSWHRGRVRRLVALERIRTQIATDLHDDIGSGLSQIAILSEVGRRSVDEGAGRAFGEVADLARGLRESMADIVWAVDPRRDRLSDLVRRTRQLAHHLFEAEGARVEFQAPAELEGIALAPDQRRHLFLFLKEALHNAARHAAPQVVRIAILHAGAELRLSVRDDGRGFDPAGVTEGQGLGSLRRRAGELGGVLVIESAPGAGTRVDLTIRPRRGKS